MPCSLLLWSVVPKKNNLSALPFYFAFIGSEKEFANFY